jgi:drug/metabolite transporter (DMT)-like permease
VSFNYWFLVFVGVSMSSLGSIFLKAGAIRISHEYGMLNAVFQASTEWRLYLGVVLYVVPVVIWIYLLKRLDITFLQPLFSLVYVITPIIAIVYLNETIPLTRWVGIGVIIIGITISARA